MKVARLHGVHDLRVTDEPAPEPGAVGPGHSVVEVTAVGLCGSDLHWYTDGRIGDDVLTRPVVPGHEIAGIVRGGPLDGRHVAVDPAIPCGHCDLCRAGQPNLCRDLPFAGQGGTDGGLRQFLVWPTDRLYPLDDPAPMGGARRALSDADGAMLEPLGVAVHAVDLGHVRLGATVAVLGCGPIGLCVLQVARAAGAATVLAVDPLPHRRAAARRLGADLAIGSGRADDPGPARADAPDPADPAAELLAATGGRGVDVVFEAVGTDAAVATAVAVAGPGARVVLAGISAAETSVVPVAAARRKGLTLVTVRRMKEVYPRAAALVAAGLVDVTAVVTHRFPLSAVEEAFRVAESRAGLKVVVEPARG